MNIKDIARVCHEANKAYCEGIGDFSQKTWEEAEEWQRKSCINGVKFFFKNPDAPDSVQHDEWLNDKVKNGWKYGPVKDAKLKTHPCIVPFKELPKEQQIKDVLFKNICKSFIDLI